MSILPHVPGHDDDRRLEAVGRGVSESELAMSQRAELHVDLPDAQLGELAARRDHGSVCLCPTCTETRLGAEVAVRPQATVVVPAERIVVHPPYPGAVDHVMTLAVYEVPAGGAR